MKTATRAPALLAILLAAVLATASPALADLDAGAGSIEVPVEDTITDKDGDADSNEDTSYTEDNDTNDGGTANNQPDDGDNAHPSGKDRSTENGGSGNQGKAESNPDDSKGPQRYEGAKGADKPNGPGGKDQADQDGNNGCGNDDDFDDDNNGWCGKPHDNGGGHACDSGAGGWECAGGGGSNTGDTSTTGCPNNKMGGDDSGHGANQGTVYDSTCDGSPSGNGNGSGKAGGKPCAGCVGNADDKNPPGQMPGGSDHNNGYECDGNSGVGKTNPAHTGCKPSPSPSLCPAGTDMAGSPATVKGCDEDEVLGRTDNVCPANSDNAGEPMTDEKDCEDNSVLGKVVQNTGVLGVAARKTVGAVGAVLPFTGAADLLTFICIAAGLMCTGIFMTRKKAKATS